VGRAPDPGRRPPPTGPGTALYLSGTALLTLGVGDSATGGAARAVVRAEAASGLGLAALVVTWLFTLQSAFRQREALVLTLAARIGLPPAGATLLERYAHLGLLDTLPQDIAAWEARLAEVQESHLAYPILAHVRSRQPVSWIGALGALLDAATLVLTTVDTSATPGLRGSAQLLSDAADPLVQGLRRDFALPPDEAPGPTRAEFEATRRRLGAAGLPLTDGEGAWAAFRAQRVAYAGVLAALARYCALPPDRT